MVPYACFLLHEPEQKQQTPRLVLVPARTAVKLLLAYSTGKINPTIWNHIFKLRRQYHDP